MKQLPTMYENGQDDFKTCDRCQADLEYEDCWACGGEGEFDLYEQDPIYYLPGQTERCSECVGRGIIEFCPGARRHTA